MRPADPRAWNEGRLGEANTKSEKFGAPVPRIVSIGQDGLGVGITQELDRCLSKTITASGGSPGRRNVDQKFARARRSPPDSCSVASERVCSSFECPVIESDQAFAIGGTAALAVLATITGLLKSG